MARLETQKLVGTIVGNSTEATRASVAAKMATYLADPGGHSKEVPGGGRIDGSSARPEREPAW